MCAALGFPDRGYMYRRAKPYEDPYASGNENRRQNRNRLFAELQQNQRHPYERMFGGHRSPTAHMGGIGMFMGHGMGPMLGGFGPMGMGMGRGTGRGWGHHNAFLGRPPMSHPHYPHHNQPRRLYPGLATHSRQTPHRFGGSPQTRFNPMSPYSPFDDDDDDDTDYRFPRYPMGGYRHRPSPARFFMPRYYDSDDDYEGDEDYDDDFDDDDDEFDYPPATRQYRPYASRFRY
ncbi:hypothetical protein P153DRAFT_358420 [Dothidotthia symphoricarpi CBS 119687]|uniref:Uncharacterized protein n=1 Tax=Dothidotthia symphoricarpi CBS 119687 TaxID=1392245 RepID=A0A6A6A8L6_9PLEO|nr:uncharacterized protein P153DRAFT_358420 [Dothidotthia symphoricarpi CBS 119687]KAF2127545.1 hypothetical protein P153DRAFT_358420 [Dothidotthia symphoricarpi CBS 119687]